MSTDLAWEEWGRLDPYFGVITDPKFRRSAIDDHVKQEFFKTGESHAHGVIATIRRHLDSNFTPRRMLDFGCGVGRLLIPFAKFVPEVVGADVSPSMLKEAQRNCDEHGVRNVRLLESDDSLSTLNETFDLIHSCIVFQHIPAERGRAIFQKLLRHLRPGGIGAIQLTYAKTRFALTHGVAATPADTSPSAPDSTRPRPSGVDPEIQMNLYNLSEIFFLMQRRGVQQVHVDYSDHGGELGVFLFFTVTCPSSAIE